MNFKKILATICSFLMLVSCFGKLDVGASKVKQVQHLVDETRDIMARNIDNMLNDQEKAAILDDKPNIQYTGSGSGSDFIKKVANRKKVNFWIIFAIVAVLIMSGVTVGTLKIIDRIKRSRNKTKTKAQKKQSQKTQPVATAS